MITKPKNIYSTSKIWFANKSYIFFFLEYCGWVYNRRTVDLIVSQYLDLLTGGHKNFMKEVFVALVYLLQCWEVWLTEGVRGYRGSGEGSGEYREGVQYSGIAFCTGTRRQIQVGGNFNKKVIIWLPNI